MWPTAARASALVARGLAPGVVTAGGLTTAVLVAGARAAAAQLAPTLELSARASDGPRVPEALRRDTRQADLALIATLRAESARLSVGAAGELPVTAGPRPGGRLAAAAASPAWRGVRVLAAGAGAYNPWWSDQPTWHAAGAAQLAWSSRAGGLWFGAEGVRLAAASGSPWLVRGVRAPAGAARPPAPADSGGAPGGAAAPGRLPAPERLDLDRRWSRQLAAGAWRAVRGGVVVSVAVRGGHVSETPRALAPTATTLVDTLTGRRVVLVASAVRGDSGQYARRGALESELRVSWTRGPLAFTGVTGVRQLTQRTTTTPPSLARVERQGWGALDATLALGRGLALTARAGSHAPPSDVAGVLAGAPAARPTRYVVLGVRVSPHRAPRPPLPPAAHGTPEGLELRADSAGRTTVRVRVTAARTVELAGDLTAWKPVAMRSAGGAVWQATVPAAPGTYRLSIRVDGDRWTAPPGLPAVDDEFGGSAALVVVR